MISLIVLEGEFAERHVILFVTAIDFGYLEAPLAEIVTVGRWYLVVLVGEGLVGQVALICVVDQRPVLIAFLLAVEIELLGVLTAMTVAGGQRESFGIGGIVGLEFDAPARNIIVGSRLQTVIKRAMLV